MQPKGDKGMRRDDPTRYRDDRANDPTIVHRSAAERKGEVGAPVEANVAAHDGLSKRFHMRDAKTGDVLGQSVSRSKRHDHAKQIAKTEGRVVEIVDKNAATKEREQVILRAKPDGSFERFDNRGDVVERREANGKHEYFSRGQDGALVQTDVRGRSI